MTLSVVILFCAALIMLVFSVVNAKKENWHLKRLLEDQRESAKKLNERCSTHEKDINKLLEAISLAGLETRSRPSIILVAQKKVKKNR